MAIVSSPRSGNTWLRRLLADALGAEQLAFHRPGDVPWDDLPDRAVLQLHWPHSVDFHQTLSRAGFDVVTLARHPFDVLISILHFARHEPDTARWLDGAFGDERALRDATPLDEAFRAYASGERAAALLAVTADWWKRGDVGSLRYEDLVADPAAELARLLGSSASLDEVLSAHDLSTMRAESVNYHAWQGRPGLWRTLLPADVADELAREHGPLLDRFGYEARPDPTLTPEDALREWSALARPSTTAPR